VTNPPGLALDAVGRRWDEPTVSLRAMRAFDASALGATRIGDSLCNPGSRREKPPGSRYTKSNGIVRTLEALPAAEPEVYAGRPQSILKMVSITSAPVLITGRSSRR